MKILLSLLVIALLAASAFDQDASSALTASEKVANAIGKADLTAIENAISPDANIHWIHAKFKNRQKFEHYLQGQFSAFDKHALVFNQEGTAEDDNISTSWG